LNFVSGYGQTVQVQIGSAGPAAAQTRAAAA